jgi:hypothetical protein
LFINAAGFAMANFSQPLMAQTGKLTSCDYVGPQPGGGEAQLARRPRRELGAPTRCRCNTNTKMERGNKSGWTIPVGAAWPSRTSSATFRAAT